LLETATATRKLAPRVTYSSELAHDIGQRYAEGASLRAIAAMPGMPDDMTLQRWQDDHEEFAGILARARRAKAEVMAREGLDLLDAADPEHKYGSARVQKAREQAAYRRWLAGCFNRSLFGDALKVDADVNVRAIIAFGDMTTAAKLAAEATQTASTRVLPHVCVPDGGDVEDAALADSDAAGDDT